MFFPNWDSVLGVMIVKVGFTIESLPRHFFKKKSTSRNNYFLKRVPATKSVCKPIA